MPIASSLLIALLATTPLVALVNYDIARPMLLILIASVTAAASINTQTDQIAAATQTLKRFTLAMLVPAAWMILQCAPIPSALENPIWATTRMALNEPALAGHISLDPGATLRGLVWYLAILAVIISTVLVTRDRRRAETILLAVTVVTTLVAAEILLGQLAPAATWTPYLAVDSNKFGVTALLAALANLAMIAMFMERHLNRAESTFRIPAREALKLLPNLCGAVISIAAIVATRQSHLSLLASLGAALMFLVPVIRRLGLPPWPAALVATALITMTGAAILPEARSVGSIDLLKMVDISPANSLGIDERALSDAPSLGNGVGSYAGVSRFYGDIGTIGPIMPSSTAIAVAIEWGRAALFVLGAIALQLFFFTLRGTLGRGRDSFFASLAAASILCVLVSSFANPGLLTPTVQIALAVIAGLGIAQSTGRTSSL